jgi:ankyrin repeat protein
MWTGLHFTSYRRWIFSYSGVITRVCAAPRESWRDVDTTDDEGDTPHAAAQSGHPDTVELLVESGTSIDVQNDDQNTPLHLAC